jgi:hypothetical protein
MDPARDFGKRVFANCYLLLYAFHSMRTLALLIGLLIVGLCGCGTPGAPLPPSLGIPKPPTDLKAVRKGDRVTLTWTTPEETTDGELMRKPGKMVLTRILSPRNEEAAGGNMVTVAVLALPPALKESQAAPAVAEDPLGDWVNRPSDFVAYKVQARSGSGKSAGDSNMVSVPLVPVPAAPQHVKADAAPQGIVLTWDQSWPPQNKTGLTARYVYRIFRREEESKAAKVVNEANMSTEAMGFADTTIEWQKHYEYWITPVTFWQNGGSKGEIEGEDSPVVPVFANDVFPPAVPTGLQAVFSGMPQQPFIDLTWTPNTDADLAGYNVYRRLGSEEPVKINAELIKTPAFQDAHVQPGTKYFYSVSAVDLRANESAKSTETAETVPQQ